MKIKLRSLITGIIALAMVFCMLPIRSFAVERSPHGINVQVFPKSLLGDCRLVSGRTVRFSCDLSCKLGYMSDGKYVSLKGVSIKENTSSYYVPEGIEDLVVVVVGDADGNGLITARDVTKISGYIKGTTSLTDVQIFAADANGDGEITDADHFKVKAFLKGAANLAGDFGDAGDYRVEYYKQTAAGSREYVLDPSLTKAMKGVIGQEVGGDKIQIRRYVYDADNENNVAAGVIAEGGSLVLKLYYKIDADENGQPDDEKYAVVVSTNASSTETYAADTLYEYLYYLNIDCTLITDDQPFDGFKFCVGNTSVYDTSADMEGKAADSYVIAPFSDGLAIFGAGGRGTLYGVHTFLQDFCGYKCYGWYPVMVMTSDEILLPEEKIVYEPFFEYRNTDWRSGWMSLYSVSHKLNGCYQSYSPEQGGNVPYLGGAGHTLSTVFCSSAKYFESHPEYFALHGGQRVPGQLCLTNDEVYEIVLGEVLSLLEEEHDPASDLQIVSLSQADNLDYCQCENCRAFDDANGSHAGSLITFVNRVASAVKEAGYSNVAFDTLAYRYTRKAPSSVRPEDNVIVRLCTFECCFSHLLDDADCTVNRELAEDLAEWSSICSRIYIWDYTTNFAATLGVFPDFHTLQKNMQFFYECGVKGVYEEGNYYVDRCDTEFSELRTFLIAELLEDPYCDYDAKMLEFCNYYYGKGGEYVKAIIEELTACIKGHVDIYCSMGNTFSIDDEEARKIDMLWSLAERAAGSSDDALAAIRRSKLSWRYVKAVLGLREFSGTLEENRDAREAFYNDLIAHGVRMIDEWTWIEEDFSEYELIPVEEWEYAARFFYLVYDLNGGTDGPPNQWSFAYTISYIVPTRSGFRFLGWATAADATEAEYLPGAYIYLDSDLTLYAVWEPTDPE